MKPKPTPLSAKQITSDDERWTVLMLVLLRLTELCETWKRSRPATRLINPRVEKAGKAAEKALNNFVRVVFAEEAKEKKILPGGVARGRARASARKRA